VTQSGISFGSNVRARRWWHDPQVLSGLDLIAVDSSPEDSGARVSDTTNKDCASTKTLSFAADGYKQSIRTIKGLKDAFLGVNDKL
jgi:hypothetical protein